MLVDAVVGQHELEKMMKTLKLTHTEDGHNKFWHITPNGLSVKVHFGRIGSRGIVKVKRFHSVVEAREFNRVKVNEKFAKGYSQ
jgi:predicted DNA-binding WGR domain protein